MSYASVAARNAPPPSQQPKPDPALLEGHGEPDIASGHAKMTSAPDVDTKISVVPSGWTGETAFHESVASSEEALRDATASAKASAKASANQAEASAKKTFGRAERDAEKWGKKAKKELRDDPNAQLGLVTVVNAVALVGVGLVAYRHRNERWDRRYVSATVIGLGALFGSQGYFGWLFYGHKK